MGIGATTHARNQPPLHSALGEWYYSTYEQKKPATFTLKRKVTYTVRDEDAMEDEGLETSMGSKRFCIED